MAYEMKEGQGSLFKNTRKEAENHPDYNGKVMVGGVEFYLNAWLKDGAKGKWMSLSLKPVDQRALKVVAASKPAPFADDPDDLPF